MESTSNKKQRGFHLNLISQYRNEIFGLAIITIVLFHFCDDYYYAAAYGIVDTHYLIIGYLGCIGSIGVEIFVLLSGIGLYFSYSKNSDIKGFYTKRFKRILMPYIPVALVFWGIKDLFISDGTFSSYMADFTFITFFTNGTRTIWFIGFMIVMYLLFPLIYKIIHIGKKRLVRAVFLMFISYMIPVIIYIVAPVLYGNTEIATTRVPMFVLGVLLGYYVKNDFSIPVWSATAVCVIGTACGIISLLIEEPSFISRYLDGVYACGLLIMLSVFFRLIKNANILRRILRMLGKYTLEIYILHVTMRNLMKSLGFDTYSFAQYFIMLIIAVIASMGLNRLCNTIDFRLSGKNHIADSHNI